MPDRKDNFRLADLFSHGFLQSLFACWKGKSRPGHCAAAALTFIGFTTNCLVITRFYYIIGGIKRLSQATSPINDPAQKFSPPSQGKTIWAVVSLALILTTVSSAYLINRIDLNHPVAVTAHRGSSRDAPENSLSAIRQAIEDGADFAEIDVQETADGKIVLLHDTDLMRIAGVNKKIWQLNYAEIKSLSIWVLTTLLRITRQNWWPSFVQELL